jgi:hypothetical protein
MPKFVIQDGVTFTHDGKPVKAGDVIELSMAQAARKIARGDIKLTAEPVASPLAAQPQAKHHAKHGKPKG